MTRQEAEELLPWFVNGTLSSDETRAVQAFIDSGEISQQEIEEIRLFAETIPEQTNDEPVFNPAILDGVMAKLDTVTQEEAVARPVIVQEVNRETKEGFFAGLLARLEWLTMPPLAKVAIAGQFVLVIALGSALLTTDSATDQDDDIVTVSGSSGTGHADVQILFTPGVTEADIRTLLVSVDGSIVAGPSSLGIYQIDLPEETDMTLVSDLLRASPATQMVQPAPKY
ncbi:MAG: hypothetical protein GKR90_10975 [Pseudomonadales bacterium]|nr:hypothetical protein [Pseudomonadales bacterium]